MFGMATVILLGLLGVLAILAAIEWCLDCLRKWRLKKWPA